MGKLKNKQEMDIPQEGRNKGFWQQGDIHHIVDLGVSTRHLGSGTEKLWNGRCTVSWRQAMNG